MQNNDDILLCNLPRSDIERKESCAGPAVSASPIEYDEKLRSSGKVIILEAGISLPLSRMRALAQEGFYVTGVATMEEAVKITQRDHYELLVINVEEPELLSMLLSQFPPATGILIITNGDTARKAAEYSGMGIHSFLIRPFSNSQFINAVKQAINRCRIIREGLRCEVLNSLEQVNQILSSDAETDTYFKLATEMSAASIYSDFISIIMIDEKTEELKVKAQLGKYKPILQDIYKQLCKTGKPLIINNDSEDFTEIVRMMNQGGISSLLHIPIIMKNKMIGLTTYIRTGNRENFSSSDLSLALILGWWSGITLENTKLYIDSQKYCTRAEKLLEEISTAQENERKRVAIDIHDGVAQWLVGASYDIKICSGLISENRYSDLPAELEKISGILHKSLKELRRAIANLPLPPLEEFGLVGTIRKSAEMLYEEGIQCSIEVLGDLPEMSLAQEKTFYWIIQESLTNIRKHSQANDVKLLIKYIDNTLSIFINDNGRGFNPDKVMKSNIPLGHMGLLGMKERARLLNGYLDIDSKPGKGTSIKFSVNFSNN